MGFPCYRDLYQPFPPHEKKREWLSRSAVGSPGVDQMDERPFNVLNRSSYEIWISY